MSIDYGSLRTKSPQTDAKGLVRGGEFGYSSRCGAFLVIIFVYNGVGWYVLSSSHLTGIPELVHLSFFTMTITNYSLAGLALLSTTASAFPHIARQLDFDVRSANGAESFGPSYARNEPAVQNIERRGAVPLSSAFPYNGAKNGLPSQGKGEFFDRFFSVRFLTRAILGGYQVPAPGDNAHRFIAPGPNDIRGPCPGTNAMANHGFIDRSGRTTFNELVDGSQNAWNLGWDLAVFLAGLEVALSGNALTGAISIGKPVPGVSLPVIGDIIDNGNNNGFFHHNGWESDGSMAWQDQAIATKEGMDPKLFEKMVKTVL